MPHLLRPALFGLLLSTSASAHLGQDQFGRFPFTNDDGVVVGGGTSWGVVLPDSVFGGYARVCEESFGPAVTVVQQQPTRQRIIAGGINGIERSSDGGCSWDVLDNALTGTFPNAFWIDPTDASHLITGTSTIGATNGLWESDDDGDTWAPLLAPRQGNFFSVAVSADGATIAAAGNDGNAHVLLLMSNDGGASFVDVSATVDDRVIVAALAFDDETLLLGGLEPSTQGFLDRVTFDGVAITLDPVGVTPRQTTHAVVFDGDIFVIARNGARGELYRQNDSALGFAAVPDGPSECLFVVDDGLIGCGKQAGVNFSLFMHSVDGVTWTPSIEFVDVHYRACPEGTVGAVSCGQFVETFCGNGIDDDLDGVDDCDDDDCHFNPLCFSAEGEGEGEGEPVGEGEGEGEGEPGGEIPAPTKRDGCGGNAAAAPAFALAAVLRRRRPGRRR